MSLRDMKLPDWSNDANNEGITSITPVSSYDIRTISSRLIQTGKEVKRIVRSLKISKINALKISSLVQNIMGTTAEQPYLPPVLRKTPEQPKQRTNQQAPEPDLGLGVLALAPIAVATGIGFSIFQAPTEQDLPIDEALTEDDFRAEISTDVEGTDPIPDIAPPSRTPSGTAPEVEKAMPQTERVITPKSAASVPATNAPARKPAYPEASQQSRTTKQQPSAVTKVERPAEVYPENQTSQLDRINNASFIDELKLTFDRIVASLSGLVGITVTDQSSNSDGTDDAPGRGGRTRWTTDTGFSLGLTEQERRTMIRLFTPAELRELNGVDPRIVRAVIATKIELNARGQDFLVFDGVRTQEEADENARRGTGSRRSRHITGHAVDIYPRIGVGQRTYNIVTEEDQFRREAASQSEVFTRNLRAQGITGDVWLGDNARGGGTVAPGQGWDVPHYQSNVEPAAPNGTKTLEANPNIVVNRAEDINVPINPTQLQSPARPSARRPTQQTNKTPWRQ